MDDAAPGPGAAATDILDNEDDNTAAPLMVTRSNDKLLSPE